MVIAYATSKRASGIRRSVEGAPTEASDSVIDNLCQGELHVSEGGRSAGSAKLDASLGEFPAQGGRVDAKFVAQARHRFARSIPRCCRCEELVGEFAHSRSARDISTLELS